MIAGLLAAVVSLVVGVAVGGVAVYIGVPLGANRAKPDMRTAFTTAGLGAALSALLTLLFGWIPIVGLLLSPAAWIGVVGHRTGATPPVAVGCGLVAWAVTFVVAAGFGAILFGVPQ